ncbi:MAG: asparagine synthetase B [Bacteroidota bacterium]
MVRSIVPSIIFLLLTSQIFASKLFIPMDESQRNHLKAYGIAYWVLKTHDTEVDWLLNYKGGSFMMPQSQRFENECIVRGVSYQVISEAEAGQIVTLLSQNDVNMDLVKLQKPPKVAVYSPKSANPWDDAVTMVMKYAEIPFDVIYDPDVLSEKLPEYDWLHLHHEDFTGQMGKFFQFKDNEWYKRSLAEDMTNASKFGFAKVSELKLAVAKKIKGFVAGGGYMFAMCTATDTYDIALAAEGHDIVDRFYDGDGAEKDAEKFLDFEKSFAFQDYGLYQNPYVVEFSTIDTFPNSENGSRPVNEKNDFFNLFEFSAKWDPIPSMLTQNHQNTIRGFMGQTTSFRKTMIKPEVIILAENKALGEARYIHGTVGKGFWSFYGGHDPEDYQHQIGEEATDLNLHPNSPGYRLILNNILFPAAKKKKQKT